MNQSIFDSPNILLHGGGYDSTLVAIYLQDKGLPFSILHVDYGHLAAKAELQAVTKQVSFLNHYRNVYGYPLVQFASLTIDLPGDKSNSLLFTGELEHSPVIPNRNGNLITLAKRFNPTTIYIGADPVPLGTQPMEDCTRGYFNKLEDALAIKIRTPYLDFTYDEYQEDLIRRMRSITGGSVYEMDSLLRFVMTCWRPILWDGRWEHCGVCKHCIKRGQLLKQVCK